MFEEVTSYDMVEVHTVGSDDVVLMPWIVVEVGIGLSIYTRLDKGLRMLPYDHIVGGAVDEEETPLEVFGTLDEVVLLIALGIVLRRVVVPLAIHDLVARPVHNGATSDTYLKGLRVRKLSLIHI